MTLNQLVEKIEGHGYRLSTGPIVGRVPVAVLSLEVVFAPLVLVPREPPVESESVMVANWLGWEGSIEGYVRIEAAAMMVGGAMVPLQFVKAEQRRDGRVKVTGLEH